MSGGYGMGILSQHSTSARRRRHGGRTSSSPERQTRRISRRRRGPDQTHTDRTRTRAPRLQPSQVREQSRALFRRAADRSSRRRSMRTRHDTRQGNDLRALEERDVVIDRFLIGTGFAGGRGGCSRPGRASAVAPAAAGPTGGRMTPRKITHRNSLALNDMHHCPCRSTFVQNSATASLRTISARRPSRAMISGRGGVSCRVVFTR